MKKIEFAAIVVAIAFPMMATAQTTVKPAPAPQSTPTSGKAMFQQYCTPCHGESGKGNGPAAAAMKVPPANLTRLSAKYKGVFPDMEVAEALRAGPTSSGSKSYVHGSETMPIWGPVFRALSNSDKGIVELRIHNLVEYIRSIQE
jgi:mono/diheme cytochrome c family protein